MARAMISPKFYAWDRNGKPLAFGKVYTYQARTNTPKPTYHSEDQIVPNTNPVILSGEGYADIYLDGSYKIVVKDSNDNEIWTADPVTQGGGDGSDTYSQFTLTGYYSTPTKVEVLGDYTSAMRQGVRITLTTLQDSGRDKEQPSTIVGSVFNGDKTAITITDPLVTPGVKSVSVTNWPFEEIGAIEKFVESNELTFKTPQGQIKETITGIERKVFNQVASIPLGDGQWAAGKVYTAYNEYLNYGGIAYKPAMDTTLPYTTQGSDPTVAPDAGLVVPFAEVQASDLVTVREDLLGPGTQLYMGDDGESVKVGDTVPGGTTHLYYNGAVRQMSPARSGVFGSEQDGLALVGGDECRIVTISTPLSDDVTKWGASEFDGGDKNSEAFDACLSALGSATIPDNVKLRVKRPIKLGDFDKIKFGADSFVEPGLNGMEVVKFQGDYATGYNVRVINTGGFSDCVAIGLTPRTSLEQVGQRYNQLFNIYINGLDKGVVFQCGDFVTAEGFASGCWYNRIYGGEIRNGRVGVEFAPGLNTSPGSITQPPATSNRNSIYDVSQHFMTGTGFNILAGADNWFYNCYYESSNSPLSLGFHIAEQSPGPVVNPNEHNRLIGCGTESVTQSVLFGNRFTEVLMWVGEKNATDDWGDCLYVSGNDPSRNPLATPSSYLQNDNFDSDFVVGREYRYLGKGVQYNGGRRDAPTDVGTEFEIYDRDHNWQEFDIAQNLNGAVLQAGILKYKKEGNWVDLAVRARLGAVSGNLEIDLPVACDAEMYVLSVNGPQFPMTGTVAPDGSIQNGYAFFVTSSRLRFGTPDGGWGSSINDIAFSIRYRATF